MSGFPPALVLGVDTPIGLTVIRELGMHGVPVHGIGASSRSIGGACGYLKGFSVRPKGQPLADWLPARIRETGAKALLAISEGDLVALAAMPSEIEGCRILSPRAERLGKVLDKAETIRIAEGLGMAVPQGWQPEAGEDFVAMASALRYPLIAKWADPPAMVATLEAAGLPLIKAERLDNALALKALLDRYAALGHWPLIQRYCPGHGLGQMLEMADGKAVLRFQHQRLHEWPVDGGVSTLCEAVPLDQHAALFAQSEALLAEIGWDGPAMVEYRHDPATGQSVLMEVNGRFWGSLPLAHLSGAHFAWSQYARAFPGLSPVILPKPKCRRARFMVPETRRLLSIMQHGGGEGRLSAVAAYFGGFFDPKMRYYVWRWRDPGPFFRDLANIMRAVLRRETP